ncbi:MAG TPA: glycosyl hydrolase [bacterium]|nr:glycosyl hydrolase [bacterium]
MPMEPANPQASPEARKLLEYLYSISGKKTLSGQHNYPGFHSDYSTHAYRIAGRHPAIWGQDFGFTADGKDGINHREVNIQEAMRQHREGSIITLMWHGVRPMDNEPNGWKESVQNRLTDAEWTELLTPGTALHRRWLAQLDVVAGYLKGLRDEHVPVLWRPYHEGNGSWFWWGGRPGPRGTQAVYRLMFEVFTQKYGLDNLIWVWNANMTGEGGKGPGPYRDYYPGHGCVDILATDVYGGNYRQDDYEELLKTAEGKPVALGEVGKVPDPAVLTRQSRWIWFMIWPDFLERDNTPEDIRALYGDPRVLSLEWLSGKGSGLG